MKRVVLHIDRLVLRGVDPAAASAVSHALQAELQGLLGQPGAAAALAAHGGQPVLHVARAPVPAGAGAPALGRAVAAGIVKGARP